MAEETSILRRIMICLSELGFKIYRNNVGIANYIKNGKKYVVKYGLCPGSSDLIGYRSFIVRQDWVGKRVAVFTAIEVKDKRGVTSDNQINFLSVARESGAITGVARSEKEAEHIVASWEPVNG